MQVWLSSRCAPVCLFYLADEDVFEGGRHFGDSADQQPTGFQRLSGQRRATIGIFHHCMHGWPEQRNLPGPVLPPQNLRGFVGPVAFDVEDAPFNRTGLQIRRAAEGYDPSAL